jgi:hypothetical protein
METALRSNALCKFILKYNSINSPNGEHSASKITLEYLLDQLR